MRIVKRRGRWRSDLFFFRKGTMNGWSTWDESYNYVKKPNIYYTNSTYKIDGIFESKLSEIVLFDENTFCPRL